ncbi:MAG: gamma-glutamyl-gamma-aminobutyrate hydrolase family protein [Tannerella sp.]|jgi:microsomal dipeptidase-like Zn-dependent dipeptidase/gamma-glutamyl-gamma-aminobutyrate hydrolase PuuD|nr:gamma-glutamyl-gamma-aminobutyrate hydrolase family protein [Tannerella sp.]
MRTFLYFTCACFLFQFTQAQNRQAQNQQTQGRQVQNQPAQSRFGSEPATVLDKFKAGVDSCDVDLRVHRPLIGLSTGQNETSAVLKGTYIHAILKAGGAPVLIPVTTDGVALREIVAGLDGLVMTGGEDVDPQWYDESPRQQLGVVDPERDVYDLKLVKLAADRNIPILGICRGEQLINVAFGGTLYQDIPSQRDGRTLIRHVQKMPGKYASHRASVVSGSQLAEIIGEGEHGVNTFHHQAVKDVAPGFRPVAWSPDSIVEAIEAYPEYPVLAVQWHPEAMVAGDDTTMLKIFRFLTDKATTFRRAKEIHDRILSVDTHTDTPFWFGRPGYSFADRERSRVNLPKMEEGKLDGVFLAAYIGQGERDDASLQKAVNRVTEIIENIHREVKQHSDLCSIALTPEDFARIKREGRKTVFIGIENGYGIGKDISNLARYKAMGALYMTLCHSYDNDICDTSTRTKKEWDGLSPFGEEVVREMNRLGIMVDLSHAGESTFWDVMKLTSVPVICSHSSARALCDHDRNLTDEQLRALAQNGGVVQVCLLDMYIHPERAKASIVHAIEHIDHIVKVAGIDHVGIGSDFDGGGGILGCQADNDLIQITVKLLEKGYTEEDLAKIWSGNFLRVMTAVQAAGK